MHVVSHVVIESLQAYALHEDVADEGHAPLPLQLAAEVAVPPEQLASRQLTVGYTQLVETPLHEPAHGELEPLQAARPTGAPVTIEHVPTLPGRLHD